MSEIKVNNITSYEGSSGPVISGITTVSSTSFMTLPRGDTAYRGGRGRGVFGGGLTPGTLTSIEYITISSTGNASSFGDLTGTNRGWIAACASATRGVWAGGADSPGNSRENTIDYVTISSTGNAFDFGDLINGYEGFGFASCSNITRGLWGGGFYPGGVDVDVIQYITIANLGNAIDFGDLTGIRRGAAACASPTRGLFGGGASNPTYVNTIDYVTISSTGNAVDFGDLITTARRDGNGSCSSATRGLWGGGAPASDAIEFVTIASLGDAQDFGDLSSVRSYAAAFASPTRGVWTCGLSPTSSNIIEYVTIASLGDAVDFGDSVTVRHGGGGCSDSHGGLG